MKRGKFLFTLISTVLVLAIAGCIFAACDDNKTVSVTFEGEGIETSIVAVQKDSPVAEPETPTRDEWVFGGWFDADGNIWDFDTPVIQDMTLHAVWSKANLILDPNGGEIGEGVQTEYAVNSGENYALPVPTSPSEALTFAGWEANGSMLTGADGKSTEVWSDNSLVTASAVWVTKGEKDVFRADAKDDGTYSISAWGSDYSAELTFPSEIGGKSVAEIGNMSKLAAQKVIVPASVKKIATRAFSKNTSVVVVDMSAFEGEIGSYAFNNSIVGVVELGGTTSIDEYAFLTSNVSLIYVPASVKNCAKGALENDLLVEVDFEGDFPTLGEKVFGEGTDDLSIIASEKAWNKLIENIDASKDFNVRVQEATGLTKGGIFTWDDELIASGKASHGFYEGEFDAYLGLGLNIAVIIDGKVELADVDDGKEANDHFYNLATTPKTTYHLDKVKKSIEKLTANENGEVIKDGVLYDYVGNDLVYTIPDGITAVAGGAGSYNTSVRFLRTGKDVTKVGDFAFAYANMFGVTIGENVTEIGDFAFFLNSYLTQLIFEGTTAPTIGQGAFCDMLNGMSYVPMTLNTFVYMGGTAKIYTVDPVESRGDEPAGYPFYEAMVKSLEGLPLGTMTGPSDSEEKPVSYSTSEFGTLQTSYFAAKDKTYESDYGTITMSGADTGYAYITFDEKSGYQGSGYIYFSAVSTPGYSFSYYDDTTAPLKIQIFTGIQDGEMQSVTVFGILGDGKLALRGDEVGIYGDIDKEYFVIDGFGNVEYHSQSGEVKAGTYKAENGSLTVTGIEGITSIEVDTENHAITYNSQVFNALGDEAGIYYDLANMAILKLDGKPKDDASGTMTLVYNGKTETMPYTIDGKKLKFKLNNVDKEWTFSKTASEVCTGYYGDYEYYLKFGVVSIGANGTFNKGTVKLTLDGYFNAELDGKDCTYYQFGTSILLFDGDVVTIYNLDLTAHTFAEPTAPEAGVYYITTSENYRVYIDGKGNLLYFTGDDYDLYTYTLGQDGTLETFTVDGHQGTTQKGKLYKDKGYGVFVYYSGGSDSFAAISKKPFETLLYYETVHVYGVSDEKVQAKSPSFNSYLSNDVLFVSTSDNPWVIYELDGQEQTQNFTYEFKSGSGESQWSADVDVKVTKKDSSYEVELAFKCASSEQKTVTVDKSEKQLVFCWLDEDKTKVGIYENDTWLSDFFCGTVKWTEDGKSFTVTDGETTYTVSGYDTDKVTVTKSEPPKSEEV